MATDNDFVADIVAEPDNPYDKNACAIYIEGSKVGYLPRGASADFFQQVADMGVTGPWRFQTKAKLSGGWGDRPMVGVLLSLPKS
ncbi:HIRAN domain-containing protein [Pseudomonas chlororaphis subsp. aureofaciens]|uniref:HIRAN domain-containing protein n=1 Tax=Pseudomonas chlororaphis TaxID=587753 RepID=UPI00355859FA